MDSERKDIGSSIMFKENIINLTYCSVNKMQVSHVDKDMVEQSNISNSQHCSIVNL
mgnify:CR=1 FL=1